MTTTITVNLSTYQSIVDSYEALKDGDSASNSDVSAALDALKPLLAEIDTENSLTRYYINVRWYDLDARPADYEDYPPLQEVKMHSYTAFTQQQVEDYVSAQTSRYADIYVTDDPSGTVGWLAIDTYFS